MATVILKPTWKLIPDTVSWPNINDFTGRELTHPKTGQTFYSAITEASRHLVDIAEEDWETIERLVRKANYKNGRYPINDDMTCDKGTPYTIDAEFEVKEVHDHLKPECWITVSKIARLVKPKEKLGSDILESKEYFMCDSCSGTGRNPKMSTIIPATHPDCPDCHGRGWVTKSNYK